MSNTGEFYDHTTWPASGSAGSSASARQELDLIEAGFNKLPPLAGQANKLIKVGAGAVDMTTSLITDDGTTVTVNGILALTSGLAFPPGTAALPSVAASGDVDTGMWFPAANNVAFSAGGAEILRVNVAGINVPLGSAPVPSVRPAGSGDTGLWFPSTTSVAASVSGVEVLRLTGAGAAVTGGMSVTGNLSVGNAGSGGLILQPGSSSNPSIFQTGDTNTGLFFPAADTIGLATGGVERMRIDSIVKFAAQPTLTSGDAIYKPLQDRMASPSAGDGAALVGTQSGENAQARFDRVDSETTAIRATYVNVNEYATVQAAVSSLYTVGAAPTGGRLEFNTDTYSLPATLTVANTAPFSVEGITLKGAGRQSTVISATAVAGDAISVPHAIYFDAEDLVVSGAGGSGIRLDSSAAANSGNRNTFTRVRSAGNGSHGFNIERSYAGYVLGCDAESNAGYGFFQNTGVHTSWSMIGNYARNNALDGFASTYSSYSPYVGCASDGNRNGYYFNGNRGVSLLASGAEFNNRAGFFFETGAGVLENWAAGYNCLTSENNVSNTGYANHTHVKAASSVINFVVHNQPVSLSTAVAGTFDFYADGVGAKLALNDPLYYNSGPKAVNGGYVHVNYSAPKLIYNKLFAQSLIDTVCTLAGSLGAGNDFAGELLITVQNATFGTTGAIKSAVYKLLVCQSSSGSQVTEIAKLGVLTTAAADDPAFSFAITSSALRATKLSTSTAAFWIAVEKVGGNVLVT